MVMLLVGHLQMMSLLMNLRMASPRYESDLFYFYQSGAINESFSDLWGEYYDQTEWTR